MGHAELPILSEIKKFRINVKQGFHRNVGQGGTYRDQDPTGSLHAKEQDKNAHEAGKKC